MSFYDRFDELCKENNKAKSPVCEELGLSKTAWVKWKNGSVPDLETVFKIQDYFSVSIDWLLETGDQDDGPVFMDDDTRSVRDIMRNRPGIRLLFDAVKDAPDADLYETLALATRLKEKSKYK